MRWTLCCVNQEKSRGNQWSGTLRALAVTGLLAAQLGCSSSDGSDDDGAEPVGGSAGTMLGSGGTSAGTGGSSAGSTGKGGSSTGGSSTGGSSTGGSSTGGSSTGGGSGLFTVDVSVSPEIETVGIVTWSIATSISEAYIEFGRDQNAFEFRAPVDLMEAQYRTLLLGMKASTQYYARITAKNGATTYTSDVYPVMSGTLPSGLPAFEVDDRNAAALWEGGGFTVQCTGLGTLGAPGGGSTTETYAFIFDKDGDPVWAYVLTDTPVSGCSRARMSVDGKSMWVGNFNNAASNGYVMRISMDGRETEDIMIRARNHDFAFLPNGHLLYWEQQNGGGYTDGKEGPDTIREMDPVTRTVTDLYDEMTDFSAQINDSQGSHTNQINYVPELDAISFSMRHTSTVGLISYPAGELLTVFGGPITRYPNMAWEYQHGHHVRRDHVVIFNNNGSNGGSSILGFQFDMTTNTATPTLDYSSGKASGAFGDVKELPNGNLYVTYSTSGIIHEISADGTLLREVTTRGAIGYSEHRKDLYGPPPPFDTESNP